MWGRRNPPESTSSVSPVSVRSGVPADSSPDTTASAQEPAVASTRQNRPPPERKQTRAAQRVKRNPTSVGIPAAAETLAVAVPLPSTPLVDSTPAQTAAPAAPAPSPPATSPPAPSPPAPPSPEPSRPAPERPIDVRPAILGVVSGYARAIESKSLRDLQRVYPGMTGMQQRGWEQFFQLVREVKAELSAQQLSVAGEAAEAQVTGTYVYLNTSTGRQERQPVSFHASFRRQDGVWRIVQVR